MNVQEVAEKMIDLVERGYGEFTVRVKDKEGILNPLVRFSSVDEDELLDLTVGEEWG